MPIGCVQSHQPYIYLDLALACDKHRRTERQTNYAARFRNEGLVMVVKGWGFRPGGLLFRVFSCRHGVTHKNDTEQNIVNVICTNWMLFVSFSD